jgi:molecular chaperone IbpA
MTQFTLSTLDLPVLSRHSVGFDQLFDQLNRSFTHTRGDSTYPPHNIVKLDDTHYVVEVAVAGFKQDELDVELKEGVLIIKGDQKKPETELQYLHKGISARNFIRSFTLSPDMEVRGATVTNGILAIALELVIPKEKQPKRIAITFK